MNGKQKMGSTLRLAAMAAVSLLAGAAWSGAHAQAVPAGTVYVFHSNAFGSCPPLDWHLVTGPNDTLAGMISWDGMKSMAHVTGTIETNRHFTLDATEIGGSGRTATITGQVQPGWLLVNVDGQGVACKSVKVPIWRPSGGSR